MLVEFDKLNDYIANGELEVAAWTSHLATMRNIRRSLEELMRLHGDKAATRVQTTWRRFSAHLRTETERRSRTTIRTPCTADRRMAEYCCQTSRLCIRAAAQAVNARSLLAISVLVIALVF